MPKCFLERKQNLSLPQPASSSNLQPTGPDKFLPQITLQISLISFFNSNTDSLQSCQVEHSMMGIDCRDVEYSVPLTTTVLQNPLKVYTRRSRLKPPGGSCSGIFPLLVASSNGDESSAQTNLMQIVGRKSRKRPRSPTSSCLKLGLEPSTPPIKDNFSGSNQYSAKTIPCENFCQQVINAPDSTRLAKRTCRRTLSYDEESHLFGKKVPPSSPNKSRYGCFDKIRRMKAELPQTCKQKRSQRNRIRKIMVLAHWLLSNVPRNCKRKRSSRSKANGTRVSWSALICDRSTKISNLYCPSVIVPIAPITPCKKAPTRIKKTTKTLASDKLILKTRPKQLPARIRMAGNRVSWSAPVSNQSNKIDSNLDCPSAIVPLTCSLEPTTPCKQAPKKTAKTTSVSGKPKQLPGRIRKTVKTSLPRQVKFSGGEIPSSVASKTTCKQESSPKRGKSKKNSKKTDELEDLQNMDLESAIQIIVQKIMSLKIDDGYGNGTIVPYKGKKKINPSKVLLDPQTLKAWNRLMLLEDGEEVDPDEEEHWKDERELFSGRIDSFIARMHSTLGPRRFMPWKGSVVDSVVGVFLTQNVSDYLSSNSYMSLCAKYPIQGSENEAEMQVKTDEKTQAREEIWKETKESDEKKEKTHDKSPDDEELAEKIQETVEMVIVAQGLEERTEQGEEKHEHSNLGHVIEEEARQTGKSAFVEKKAESMNGKKKKVNKKVPIDWEPLRKLFSHEPRSNDHMDSVDWEAVRCAKPEEVAEAIKDRGQQNQIAERIQGFLNRLIRLHGSIDLEWLRYCPPKKVKDYLLEVNGLGLKSVECVRLLALEHVAFPVDVNVGRIAIRLGWVPLQPLPGDLQLHSLAQYPPMDEIQKYLWPRLCTNPQRNLYEFHYLLITLGKVICTKKKPNCNACPMKGECKYFASARASAAKRALPAPADKSIIASTSGVAVDENLAEFNLNNHTGLFLEGGHQKSSSEPIIEEPPSPKSENHAMIIKSNNVQDLWMSNEEPASPNSKCQSLEVRDIEDLCKEDDAYEVINISSRKSKAKNRSKQEVSKALVVVPPEVASFPVRKLKTKIRLRTEHQVYELPDWHQLVAGFEPREFDDPCPYLLAVWPDETSSTCEKAGGSSCNATKEEKNVETIRGTIMIPCRTATRSRFPLNGTYFQVNEVLADHESSQHPIDVPRDWIWNLTRRTAYAGTSVISIFKGLSIEEAGECFWRGFICVRGFDRKTRAPRPLSSRLHDRSSQKPKEKDQIDPQIKSQQKKKKGKKGSSHKLPPQS